MTVAAKSVIKPGDHDWFIPPMVYFQEREMECCRKCGFIRTIGRENAPCRGVVKVGLRAPAEGKDQP